jgi:acetyl esterase/lipase
MMKARSVQLFLLLMFNVVAIAMAQNQIQPTTQTSNQSPSQTTSQPPPIPLWPDGAPGAKGGAPEDVPSIQMYQPPADKATGAAIVVCPGGGYRALAPHEGHDIAVWLNSLGVTAVVLKYRLGPKYQHPAMMNDALRAIRYTRSKASEWKIDPNRVGIMGFSAGGHLASTAATHFDNGDPYAVDPIEKFSSRPDLAILCYPVITMTDPFAHKGSRQNLLGAEPTQQMIDLMSNEKQVTEKTPTTFLFHTEDDAVVPVENILMFAAALRQKKVPYELHVFERGRHGVGLAPNDPVLSAWPKLLENWLRTKGFLKQPQRVSEVLPVKRRNPELVKLIDELRVTPPEFAASGMIRISGHPEVDNEWKTELLEEAFRTAFKAEQPCKMRFILQGAGLRESRPGYMGLAYDMRLDRLSLQLFAIKGLIGIAPRKARALWNELEKPKLSPLKCEDSLVYDISEYYGLIVELARRAFTPEEKMAGEPIRFIDSNIVNISSPAEVILAAALILDNEKIDPTPFQFNGLVETYSRALDNVAKDNRSFSAESEKLVFIPLSLASECRRRGAPVDFLLSHFRDYLVGQLTAPRCGDSLIGAAKSGAAPKYITAFNDAVDLFKYIPKITDEEIRPRKFDGEPRLFLYWQTPRAKRLFQKIDELRFGAIDRQPSKRKTDKPPEPLRIEEKRTSEWQYKLSDFLRELAEWKPEHEASEADYFHQKCYLFNNLIEISPNSSMRLKMLADYLVFLERTRFERENFIEWFEHVSDLMRRTRVMEKEERELALDALRDSNDHVLQLCAKLVPVFQAVRLSE